MKKILTIIALVMALQLAVVSATYAAPPAWGGDSGNYHHVVYGETMYSIGRTYDADPHCIAEANGIWNPNVIYAGEVLYIPSTCASYPWYGHQPVNYPSYGHGNQGQGHYDQQYNCTVNCYQSGYHPQPKSNYGYDYTGYYYDRGQDRYSHTCGYQNNCW